ncbi:hypothetical protein ACTXPG_12735 [Glutamicibacter arilaitensis]|uniref:hypothetical protein n=1 Tax=Glutamicibacter arilaitensis TaxID=256701 RepID=UPI003FD03B1A
MTEKSPHSPSRTTTSVRRAPGWIAPVLSGVLVAAVTWGIGSTVFRGALVERGLPETVNEASDDERTMWELGAQLEDLASQARKLAELAPGESASSVAALASSLSQGSALLGQLRFDDQQPVALAQSYSPEAVVELASKVSAVSASMPDFSQAELGRDSMLAQIAFQINLDARGTVAALGEEQDLGLALPLSEVSGEADQNDQPVACLPDAALLDPAKKITEAQNIEPTAVARALDRGYALDFLLQLKAARGADAAKDAIEARRSELGRQLHALRGIVDGQCADLHEPAYALPEDGLANLAALAQGAEQDFADALVIAAGNTDGEAGTQISATAFSVIQALHSSDPANRILENAAAGE